MLVLQTYVFEFTESIVYAYFKTRVYHDVISATPIFSVGKNFKFQKCKEMA